MSACEEGHVAVAEYLIDKGAVVNAKNNVRYIKILLHRRYILSNQMHNLLRLVFYIGWMYSLYVSM